MWTFFYWKSQNTFYAKLSQILQKWSLAIVYKKELNPFVLSFFVGLL